MSTPLLGNVITDLFGWLGDRITGLTDWLDGIAGEWWFLLVILAIAFFDSVIPIVPSETAVIIGGVAAGQGDQSLVLVILCGAAGAFLGDNFAYTIGPALQPDDQPACRIAPEDGPSPGVGEPPDPHSRRSAADHRPVHSRRAHRPHPDVGPHAPGPRVVRPLDRVGGADLGDLRRRARLHLRQSLQGRPHRRLRARLRRRPLDHPDHRARSSRPQGQRDDGDCGHRGRRRDEGCRRRTPSRTSTATIRRSSTNAAGDAARE